MFEKNNISIITGKPGSGKTVYAIKLANELQEYYGKNVLFITLENTEEKIKQSQSNNIQFKITSLSNSDLEIVIKSIENENLRSKARYNKKIDVVFIDYLQLISVESENYEIGCSKLIDKLKEVAAFLNSHIVIISQCSRSADSKKIELPSYIEKKIG